MTKNNKIFDDISKMASSTMATMVNIKNDLATYITHQIRAAIKNMDFVSKNDFLALKKSVEALSKELNNYTKDIKKEVPSTKAKVKRTSAKSISEVKTRKKL